MNHIADLNSLRIDRVFGSLNKAAGFEEYWKILKFTSDLIERIFGVGGKHAQHNNVVSFTDNSPIGLGMIAVKKK